MSSASCLPPLLTAVERGGSTAAGGCDCQGVSQYERYSAAIAVALQGSYFTREVLELAKELSSSPLLLSSLELSDTQVYEP